MTKSNEQFYQHGTSSLIESRNVLYVDSVLRNQFVSVFRGQLEPLYGPQDSALDKIFINQDRTTNILINDEGEISGIGI